MLLGEVRSSGCNSPQLPVVIKSPREPDNEVGSMVVEDRVEKSSSSPAFPSLWEDSAADWDCEHVPEEAVVVEGETPEDEVTPPAEGDVELATMAMSTLERP